MFTCFSARQLFESTPQRDASEPEGFFGRHLKTSILVKVVLLSMEEILHQLTSNLSWYLQGFSTITGGDCRISRTINSTHAKLLHQYSVDGGYFQDPWYCLKGFQQMRPFHRWQLET